MSSRHEFLLYLSSDMCQLIFVSLLQQSRKIVCWRYSFSTRKVHEDIYDVSDRYNCSNIYVPILSLTYNHGLAQNLIISLQNLGLHIRIWIKDPCLDKKSIAAESLLFLLGTLLL